MPILHHRRAVAVLAAGLLLAACELGLHEVQRTPADDCALWHSGCPPLAEFDRAGPASAPSLRIDRDRAGIVAAAIDAPYRPCDGIGVVCQGRIIGDVLWDQYLMVLAGRSDLAATAASAERAPPAAAAASPAASQPASGRIVRTHGTRAGAAAPAAARR